MITEQLALSIVGDAAGQEVTLIDGVESLGKDSLELLSAFECIERLTGVTFPDKVLVEFQTVKQIVDFITSHESNLSS